MWEDNIDLAIHLQQLANEHPTQHQAKYEGVMVYWLLQKEAEQGLGALEKRTGVNSDPKRFPESFDLRRQLIHALLAEEYLSAASLEEEINKTGETLALNRF